MEILKGYKGFSKGLICKGKQYAENTVFEEDTAKICESGMHFCVNPLDVLDYYPLFDENGTPNEFAEVEALAEATTDDEGKKYCTTKLRIGKKLTPDEFIDACTAYAVENCNMETASAENRAKPAASGDCAQLAASGYGAKLTASGDYAKLAASGDCAKLAASGYGALLSVTGESSIAAGIGLDNVAKAETGSWIVLAEWIETEKGMNLKCVKAVQVDGESIKANTWYKLRNGEFEIAEKI